ncbi:SUKH-4 family immunity protein [Actinospica sp. MGRD01-02]|uniref:SUKH-4 family immunity protein n=1 Tax=Actinospica acidithermotolerans TaxID=2828514 RepID=A0A941ECW0_9ACTN|nr:SUKH-4 family immunity protein [Actinospica acidithermotolerans]MBR7828157.1 SUKH-4 family immunity protein [Actinospica acidithermotolerans]
MWRSFALEALAPLGVSTSVVEALTGRGLPANAFEVYVRDQARELEVADLPGCGQAAFLGRYTDEWNTYWLRLADSSVWMRWGILDRPAESTQRINTSVEAFQAVLGAWCEMKSSSVDETDEQAYEDLVTETICRAVGADPAVFADGDGWWPVFFEELEYTLPRMVAGDRPLHQLVRCDASGRWILEHPGYDEAS